MENLDINTEINKLINVISNCIDGSPECLQTDQQYAAWIQKLEGIKERISKQQTGAFHDVINHLHPKDNAILIVVPHDADGSSFIVTTKEGGNNELFQRHLDYMLDIAHERLGYDHEAAPRPIKALVNSTIAQWKGQYDEN